MVKCEYSNRKPICDFLFDDNSNVNPIFYLLRDICKRNVHDLDPDDSIGIFTFDLDTFLSPYLTVFVGNSNAFSTSTVCKMITSEVPDVLDSNFWSWRWRSRTLKILVKIAGRSYFVGMCDTIGASMFVWLFSVTFRGGRTHIRTRTVYDSITTFNSVGTVQILKKTRRNERNQM